MNTSRTRPASLALITLAAACGSSGQGSPPVVEASPFEACVARGGTVAEHWSTENFHGAVTSLAVSGSTVVLGSADGSVKQWQAAGDPTYGTTFHEEGAAMRALAITRDGHVIGGDAAGRLSEWRLSDAQPMRTTTIGEPAVTAIAADESAARIAVQSGEEPDIRIVERATGTISPVLESELWGVSALAFGPGDVFVTAGHFYGTPMIERRSGSEPGAVVERWNVESIGNIRAVALDATGTTLVAAGDGFVGVFEAQALAAGPVASMTVPNHAPVGIALLPGGELFATAGREGSVKLWRVATGELVTSIAVPAPAGVGVDVTSGQLFTAGDAGVLHAVGCR